MSSQQITYNYEDGSRTVVTINRSGKLIREFFDASGKRVLVAIRNL
jgi:hypothetical protein